ncbi:M28 family peptidase [Streptomyces sp. NPDC051907]|uniref:M28 family peptidase n=1 Tax=Streptomyces sp. NPDC051907 TaxID=3155284 RepID=UPI0034252F3B
MTGLVTVDGDRLWRSLMALAEVGAYDDERTGLRGVNRLALTDADAAGRRLVVSWMEEAGLTVRVDRMGNVYGRREGTDPAARPVLTGSHIDSVATAGAFDGCLGVLGGIEVVRTLDHRGPGPGTWTGHEGAGRALPSRPAPPRREQRAS